MGDRIGIADNSHIIIYVRTITLKLLFNNLTIYYLCDDDNSKAIIQ
jgi:hypothetical protein